MRELLNIKEFEDDYKRFYNGDINSLDFNVVADEVRSKEGDYELAKYESNVGHGKTFFFDEVIIFDKDSNEYEAIATYIGHGNH